MSRLDSGEPGAEASDDPQRLAQLEPLVASPPSPRLEACVIIPVRNEAANIAATLAALAEQCDGAGRPLSPDCYEVIVLANNCTDNTVAVARQFARQNRALALHVVELTLPPAQANVGRARRLLMDEAYRRLASLGHQRGIIASTDGDTRVAPQWLAATLLEVAGGAEGVGGRILANRVGHDVLDTGTRLYHLRDVTYKYLLAEAEAYLDPQPGDPWPRHYQHTGASMAVTAAAYACVGGLPDLPSSEDVALYRRLVRRDIPFRHSPAVRVVTSARQSGRACDGMADKLHEWTAMNRQHAPYLVEAPASVLERVVLRHQLRQLWQGRAVMPGYLLEQRLAGLADRWRLDCYWLVAQLSTATSFGVLWERVEGVCSPPTVPMVEISEAISELRTVLAKLRPASSFAPLLPLEKVESVFFVTLPTQMPQERPFGDAVEATCKESLVNLVASQGVTGDKGRPMHQEQLPTRFEVFNEQVLGSQEVSF